MKALLSKESGGRTEPMGLAEAGSRHRLGLKGQEEEAGPPEPRESHPSARRAVRHVVCADERPRTWRRVHGGAGGRNGRRRKNKTMARPFGCLLSPGMQ